jgi:hypothetical protein
MHTGDFTQRRLQKKNTKRRPYAQKLLHTESFTNQKYFARRCFAQRRFCIEKFLQREACTWNTEQLLHTRVFSRRSFYTQTLLTQRPLTQKLWHREALTQSSFYKRNLLQTEAFTHWTDKKLLRAEAFTPNSLYTQTPYTQKLLLTDAFRQPFRYAETARPRREPAVPRAPIYAFTQNRIFSEVYNGI